MGFMLRKLRRPKWSMLLLLLAISIFFCFLFNLPKSGNTVKKGRDLSRSIFITQESSPVRISKPTPKPTDEAKQIHTVHKKFKHFELVSERNDTIHKWPWPEAARLSKICAEIKWSPALPNATVIISFHENEDVFIILHTVHAIVKQTPRHLLHEIILIDDNTRKDDFRQVLEWHINEFVDARVRLVRSKEVLGLIRARLMGIRMATSPVVVVLDSHIEPGQGWLEPLLHEITLNRKTLATPYLDWFQKNYDHWEYRHGARSWRTYFDWELVFGFQALSQQEMLSRVDNPTMPVRCALTVGQWAMDKTWFEEVGAFDEGMQLWGGENIDLSVRVWLFGGRVVNVPCSHVAHREAADSRAYRETWVTMIRTNQKRFAEVWMDEYKEYFYLYKPDALDLDAGDLSSRLALKARAQHNFTWFLTNVFPELHAPGPGNLAWGGLQVDCQAATPCCLASMISSPVNVEECDGTAVTRQGVFWSTEGHIRMPIHIINDHWGQVWNNEYTSYHNTSLATVWFHVRNGPIIAVKSKLCLEMTLIWKVILAPCEDKPLQRWRFKYYAEDYDKKLTSIHGNEPGLTKYLHQRFAFQIRTTM